ncbi:MAG TPA: metallophosphoesterase [Thermomicrobiaceae bacterium]|nr:metallophosphoesterase [Thermomicrobiaceae bacterium]
MSNRSRLFTLAAALIGALAALFIWESRREPRTLRLRRFRVHLPGLPSGLAGTRIAFLSDFHVNGPGHGNELTPLALDLVRREDPDLLLLGGDYFDHSRCHQHACLFDRLREFALVFGILGNHDLHRRGRYSGAIVKELGSRGVPVLWNRAERVALRGGEITIAGVGDPYIGYADPREALQGTAEPRILLAHAPSIVERLPPGAAALVLAGHTHGGQIRLSPFDRLTPLDSTWWLDRLFRHPPQRFLRGFHWVNGTLLYVSHGIGTTRLPLRFLAPPEAVLIELVASAPHPEEPCDQAARYVEELPSATHQPGEEDR